MPDKNSTIVELLKYPVLVFSVVLALVAMKYLLNLEFGVVTEVTTQGVKFAEHSKATLEALGELESRLNESTVRIQALEEQIQAPSTEIRNKVQAEAFSAAQTVSDTTAQISRIRESFTPDETQDRLRGYIWIGNYNGSWKSAQLARLDTGQPVKTPPSDLQPSTEYKVLGNMVLRDGLPGNDTEYFRGRANLGVIPRGSSVTLLKSPVGIDREFAVQYWAEVELLRKP